MKANNNLKLSKMEKSQVKDMIMSTVKKNPLKIKVNDFNNSVSTAGLSVYFVQPALGAGVNQRTSDNIQLDRMECLLSFTYGDATNFLKVAIVQEIGLYNNLTLASVWDLGYSGSVDTTSLELPFAKNKVFHTLWQKDLSLVQTANSAIQTHKFTLHPKIKNVTFLTGTTTPMQGGLYLVAVSDSGAVLHPAISGHTVLYYRDV